MLGSGTGRAGNYDKFMPLQYQLHNGIPGLTDGGNAVIRDFENKHAAVISGRKVNKELPYIDYIIKVCQNGNFEDGSLQVQLGDEDYIPVDSQTMKNGPVKLNDAFSLDYYNAVQGLIRIVVTDEAKADELLADKDLVVNLKFKKRGLAGVPTFMDWDGCVGSAKIMLQR